MTADRWKRTGGWTGVVLIAGLLARCDWAFSQTLDDVQVEAQRERTVMHITFHGDVQFVRADPSTSSDLLHVYFRIVALDNPNSPPVAEEARLSPADAPGPSFRLTYPFQANAALRQLNVQFAKPVMASVQPGRDGRSIDVVIVSAPPATAATTPPSDALALPAPSTAASPPARYAISLERHPAGDTQPARLIPRALENCVVFTNPLAGPGKGYEVDAGYFDSADAAEAMRGKVLASFPQAEVFAVDVRANLNLQAAAAASGSARAPEPPRAMADEAQADVAGGDTQQALDAHADALLGQAADAVTAKDYDHAIERLDQVLLLPPNASTQTALELLGVTLERAGRVPAARAEYQRYLSLFPQGEGPDRVRQRLANLPADGLAATPTGTPALASAGDSADAGAPVPRPAGTNTSGRDARSVAGSISQFYYGGQTRATTILAVPTGINQASLTGQTQSAVVTNLDATARFRDADSDSRFVLRDTNSASLIDSAHGTNLLSAAYFDYRDLATSLGIRVGRQSAVGAGALGLFDGVAVSYAPAERWRVTVSVGQPADPLTTSHERFAGFDAQVDEVLPGLGLGVYGIDQTVDGAVSRRALGGNLRYFKPDYSLYVASDYDLAFKSTNSTLVQGSMTTDAHEVFSLLFDHRRAPSLDLGNALIGSNFVSLQSMLQQLGYAQVQQLAALVAAVSRQAGLSYARPLSEHWQGTADVRWTDVGALPAIGLAPAQPATGAQMSYSLVTTGSNLYSAHDANVFNLTLLNSEQLHGGQIAYNNFTGVWNNQLSLEPSVRLYVENNESGQHTTRWTPGMRAAYRLSPAASLETEVIIEISHVSGASSSEDARNDFFYLGYRYDFR